MNERKIKKTYLGYQWALVTGASSGIGEAFAHELTGRGMNILLIARSEDKLSQLAHVLEQKKVSVRTYAVDLSSIGAADKVASWCIKEKIEPDLLVNNAGFGLFGTFEQHSPSEYADMIHLNVRSLTELCAFFLPAMVQRRRGGVINVASQAGLVPVPYYSVYGASKAYVVNFTYALWGEYRQQGIRLTCLAPGPTRTAFQKRAGSKSHGYMQQPREVVLSALAAFERNRPLVVTGSGRWVTSFFPVHLIPKTTVVSYVAKIFKPEKRITSLAKEKSSTGE